MNYPDFKRLTRKQLAAHFERERQEWLSAGMSEADIFRVHFGEPDENGRGGDYRVWLDERNGIRPDHKYAPGTPRSLEDMDYEGDWFTDNAAAALLLNIEQTMDIEAILQTLTPKQEMLVRALVFNDVSPAEYAKEKGLSKSAISQMLEVVRKKIKIFYFRP